MIDGIRKIVGIIIYIIGGLYVFISEVILLGNLWGTLGVVLGVVFFPILLIAMPFYALFAFGNWILLVISIITPLLSGLIMGKD